MDVDRVALGRFLQHIAHVMPSTAKPLFRRAEAMCAQILLNPAEDPGESEIVCERSAENMARGRSLQAELWEPAVRQTNSKRSRI